MRTEPVFPSPRLVPQPLERVLVNQTTSLRKENSGALPLSTLLQPLDNLIDEAEHMD